MMAIGGETTGVILTTENGVKYELDFGKDRGLARIADSLSGKQVAVTGVLHVIQGVEVGERHIIEVTGLAEAKS
jgi:hypothetical protein